MTTEDRLQKLQILIGKWSTTVTMLNQHGEDGKVTRASDIYTWSSNRKFVQHDVDADMGGGSRVQSFEVIALDPSGSGYVSRSYDPDGTFSDFSCQLIGKSWRIVGKIQRFDGVISEDKNMLTGRWEQNNGSKEWRH